MLLSPDATVPGGILELGIERVLREQIGDLLLDVSETRRVVTIEDSLRDQASDRVRFAFREAASGHRRRADADTAGDERAFRVVGDGVLVGCDAHFLEQVLRVLAGY